MAKHIEDRAAFDLVRYANCWEDADILCEALQPAVGKRFLSIASAGDNSFSLLSHGAEVIAVDLSQTQLACVELRKAAFANLDHADLLKFLGVRQSDSRTQVYRSLRDSLPMPAQEFWNGKPDSINNGFIHDGKFESYFATFRQKALRLVHSRKTIDQLLQPRSRQERIDFFNRRWNTFRWRLLFKIFFSRFVMGRLGRDPEFFRYVEGPVAERILERTKHATTELETHNNPYLTYILTGNYGDALPHYLRPEKFDAIRNNLDNLTLTQASFEKAAVDYGGDGFDGFNLSDIFEYLAPEICHSIYSALLKKCRPNARFAYWNMLVPRSCPEDLTDQVESLQQLSSDLFFKDKAWFYSAFVVEQYCGAA